MTLTDQTRKSVPSRNTEGELGQTGRKTSQLYSSPHLPELVASSVKCTRSAS